MDKNYLPIIEKWTRSFINTMNSDVKDGYAKSGEDFGEIPKGIKIIFDGYGYNEETDQDDDVNMLSFAVFIHKNSLTEYFPPHESNFNMIIHRPSEECYINVWYTVKDDYVNVLPFEDMNNTELDHKFLIDLIFKIEERPTYIPG
tara:strand:+ start:944 stop:1378 length:435 start_codon:yes stop_codon:yes gene_type:complete